MSHAIHEKNDFSVGQPRSMSIFVNVLAKCRGSILKSERRSSVV